MDQMNEPKCILVQIRGRRLVKTGEPRFDLKDVGSDLQAGVCFHLLTEMYGATESWAASIMTEALTQHSSMN